MIPRTVDPKGEPAAERPLRDPRNQLHRSVIVLTLAIWSIQVVMMTARLGFKNFEEWGAYSASRLALAAFGALLSYGMYLLLRNFQHRSFVFQGASAAILSSASAAMMTFVNIGALGSISPAPMVRSEFLLVLQAFMYWYWFYLCWSAAYLALSYDHAAAQQERRAALLEVSARDAQMRALTYQLNPHFLFNALNSAAALVKEAPDRAEEVLVGISEMLRSTLELDPLTDIPLRLEIELQLRYLEIEQVRFPSRLSVSIDVPEELQDTRVPPLILQPLVENAVRHGMARTRAGFEVEIRAWRENARVIIKIINDAVPSEGEEFNGQASGLGIGLKNVRDRLSARYGRNFRMDCNFEGSRFAATVGVPIEI